jgi:hypothetical protein
MSILRSESSLPDLNSKYNLYVFCFNGRVYCCLYCNEAYIFWFLTLSFQQTQQWPQSTSKQNDISYFCYCWAMCPILRLKNMNKWWVTKQDMSWRIYKVFTGKCFRLFLAFIIGQCRCWSCSFLDCDSGFLPTGLYCQYFGHPYCLHL